VFRNVKIWQQQQRALRTGKSKEYEHSQQPSVAQRNFYLIIGRKFNCVLWQPRCLVQIYSEFKKYLWGEIVLQEFIRKQRWEQISRFATSPLCAVSFLSSYMEMTKLWIFDFWSKLWISSKIKRFYEDIPSRGWTHIRSHVVLCDSQQEGFLKKK
jgi:hypothetical protein